MKWTLTSEARTLIETRCAASLECLPQIRTQRYRFADAKNVYELICNMMSEYIWNPVPRPSATIN